MPREMPKETSEFSEFNGLKKGLAPSAKELTETIKKREDQMKSPPSSTLHIEKMREVFEVPKFKVPTEEFKGVVPEKPKVDPSFSKWIKKLMQSFGSDIEQYSRFIKKHGEAVEALFLKYKGKKKYTS